VNREPRTANCELRTANREPRTENREPRTVNREPRTAHRPTSQDIARAAGVSRTTVSLVLNGKENTGISVQTQARVLETAASLGYVPNSAARMLVSGRSRTLGLVLAHGDLMSFDAFAPPLMFGISRVCNARGYKLLVEAVEGEHRRNSYLDLVKSKSIDALIVLNSSAEDEGLVRLIDSRFPVLLFGSIGHPKENSVRSGTEKAAEEITRHLLNLGHRKVAHITYAPKRYTGSMERLRAFRRALDKAKIRFDETLVANGDFSAESGYRAMQEILGRQRPFTALFAGNDTIAMGAMAALRDAGLSVPGDVAVVGFDDLPIASYSQPPLTTVNTQATVQGEQAALAAFELLEGRRVGTRRCHLALKLIIRDSCGAKLRQNSRKQRI
jgi:DNA-binding LacI/PurR family transcriptional regulator